MNAIATHVKMVAHVLISTTTILANVLLGILESTVKQVRLEQPLYRMIFTISQSNIDGVQKYPCLIIIIAASDKTHFIDRCLYMGLKNMLITCYISNLHSLQISENNEF